MNSSRPSELEVAAEERDRLAAALNGLLRAVGIIEPGQHQGVDDLTRFIDQLRERYHQPVSAQPGLGSWVG